MEKQIYCLIPPRRKCIKFNTQHNVSDTEVIREKLVLLAKTDMALAILLKNKFIIFQHIDESGEWCDIDESEEIMNKSEIKAVLIPIPPISPPSALQDVKSKKLENSSDSCTLNNDIGVMEEVEVNVIYTEPYDANNFTQHQAVGDDNLKNNIEIQENAENINLNTVIQEKEKIEIKSEVKFSSTKIETLKMNALPPLTYDLEQKLQKGSILMHQTDFIRFWGQYLYQKTCGNPSKQNYADYATAIVSSYPELQGGIHGNGIIRTQLSTWIRNHRISIKGTRGKKRGIDDDKLKCEPINKAEIISNKLPKLDAVTNTDISSALDQLKNFTAGKNVSHVKKLLEVTKSVRRPWIENEAIRVTNIVEKYPPLADFEMITYESINVVLNSSEDIINNEIINLLDELYAFYSHEQNGAIVTERTDRSECNILKHVSEELSCKRFKKNNSCPLWTIEEVYSDPKILSSNEGDAPRAVVFVEDDIIEQAFIVCDGSIKIEVPAPNTGKVLKGLLSTYYTWHRSFPNIYASALEFFCHKIFKSQSKNKQTIAKFMRKLDNFKISKENNQ